MRSQVQAEKLVSPACTDRLVRRSGSRASEKIQWSVAIAPSVGRIDRHLVDLDAKVGEALEASRSRWANDMRTLIANMQ